MAIASVPDRTTDGLAPSAEGQAILRRVRAFMDEWILPNEERYEAEFVEAGLAGYPPVMDELKAAAKDAGLWNLFLPHLEPGAPGIGLRNVDYAHVAEVIGRVPFAAEAFNCNAPDSGNMEILSQFGTERVKDDWLKPLLEGEIRSAFCMTEPDVASSDATNVGLSITQDDQGFRLHGRKWFSSGAGSHRCRVLIVMGKTDPSADRHHQQSMIVVPKDAAGVSLGRSPQVFGYDHAGGHPEVIFDDVRVPADHLLGEVGGGFAISQARLGPGRVHHCMRAIGLGERALELMVRRSLERSTFGQRLAHRGVVQDWVAESRIELDMARLYVLDTARRMDAEGNRAAALSISGIKVAVPRAVRRIIDHAIQLYGAEGFSQFTPLAAMYGLVRTMQVADGPDEVHKMTIARQEYRRYDPSYSIGGSAAPA